MDDYILEHKIAVRDACNDLIEVLVAMTSAMDSYLSVNHADDSAVDALFVEFETACDSLSTLINTLESGCGVAKHSSANFITNGMEDLLDLLRLIHTHSMRWFMDQGGSAPFKPYQTCVLSLVAYFISDDFYLS